MPAETYLSIRDLADRYRVHPSTIWRWVKSGLLFKPTRLAPNTVRWPLSLIEKRDAELLAGNDDQAA